MKTQIFFLYFYLFFQALAAEDFSASFFVKNDAKNSIDAGLDAAWKTLELSLKASTKDNSVTFDGFHLLVEDDKKFFLARLGSLELGGLAYALERTGSYDLSVDSSLVLKGSETSKLSGLYASLHNPFFVLDMLSVENESNEKKLPDFSALSIKLPLKSGASTRVLVSELESKQKLYAFSGASVQGKNQIYFYKAFSETGSSLETAELIGLKISSELFSLYAVRKFCDLGFVGISGIEAKTIANFLVSGELKFHELASLTLKAEKKDILPLSTSDTKSFATIDCLSLSLSGENNFITYSASSTLNVETKDTLVTQKESAELLVKLVNTAQNPISAELSILIKSRNFVILSYAPECKLEYISDIFSLSSNVKIVSKLQEIKIADSFLIDAGLACFIGKESGRLTLSLSTDEAKKPGDFFRSLKIIFMLSSKTSW